MNALLLLVRADQSEARSLGTRLMQRGHTVFLSDCDTDIEFFGDVVDGVVEINPALHAAVFYDIPAGVAPERGALRERAVLHLPADDLDLATFADSLKSTISSIDSIDSITSSSRSAA